MESAFGQLPAVLQSGSDLLEIPAQLVLFLLPVLAYALFRRRRGGSWETTRDRLGWRVEGCSWGDIGLAVAVGLGISALGFGVLWMAPERVLDAMVRTDIEGLELAFVGYLDWELTLAAIGVVVFREAIYVALGEELLFRGLIGGLFFRRFGFRVGNVLQTAVFVLPHLLILVLVPALWPMIVVWAAAGWAMGWLYFRTGSIVPGWIAHTLVNVLAALQLLLLFF